MYSKAIAINPQFWNICLLQISLHACVTCTFIRTCCQCFFAIMALDFAKFGQTIIHQSECIGWSSHGSSRERRAQTSSAGLLWSVAVYWLLKSRPHIGSLLQTLEVENKDGSKVQHPFCHPAAFMHITIYLDEIGPLDQGISWKCITKVKCGLCASKSSVDSSSPIRASIQCMTGITVQVGPKMPCLACGWFTLPSTTSFSKNYPLVI